MRQQYNNTIMSWIYSYSAEEKMGEIRYLNSVVDVWESFRQSYYSSTTNIMLSLKSQIQKN